MISSPCMPKRTSSFRTYFTSDFPRQKVQAVNEIIRLTKIYVDLAYLVRFNYCIFRDRFNIKGGFL
jgi:hypothetical protein